MNKTISILLSTSLLACTVVLPVFAKDRIIFTRGAGTTIGFNTALFVANADGTGERKLLTTSEFDYSPSFSKDGKWIVFTSERNGSSDIYRVHVDGSGLERLTDDPSFDDQAVLSPDGKQLAFVSTRAQGTADIWVLDLKSRKLRNLTRGRGGNFRPSWSLDGKWLAFSSDRDTPVKAFAGGFSQLQEAHVYVIRADGKGLRQLTATGEFAGSPRWSPDGRQIVCYAMDLEQTRPARVSVLEALSQIISVDLATGARTELTAGPGLKVSPRFVRNEVAYLIKGGRNAGIAFTKSGQGAPGNMRNPDWSPDGSQVVYQKVDAGPLVQNQPLFSKNHNEFEFAWSNAFPAFSHDGTRLAVTTDFDGATHGALSVMDWDGNHAKRIVSDKESVPMNASWSPDDQWIVYGFGTFFRDLGKPAQIIMERPDGSDARELTSGAGNSGFPSFSSDGKRIVYRVWGEQGNGLRILNLADGSIMTLTTEPDNFPAWSPTDNVIEFTRAVDGAYDVFSIRSDGTDLKRLTTAPGNDAHGVWSPDGKHIVFSSARLGFRDEGPLYDSSPQPYAELFIMSADGSSQRPLTDNKWEDATPAWQPKLSGK